jgi:hypothetical protein
MARMSRFVSRSALLVTLLAFLGCGSNNKNPGLDPCGAGGTCPANYICNASDGLCYHRGANFCPVTTEVVAGGIPPAPDAATFCNQLPYCCDETFTLSDGGMATECELKGGVCSGLTTECPFGCFAAGL